MPALGERVREIGVFDQQGVAGRVAVGPGEGRRGERERQCHAEHERAPRHRLQGSGSGGALYFPGCTVSSTVRRGGAAVALVGALFVPAAARADGDPASDTLYKHRVFLPPSVGGEARAGSPALQRATADAERAGMPVRVALIAAPSDLGAIPSLFGRPAQYARFLGMELQFVYPGRLLVVMPQGAALSRRGQLVPNAAVDNAKVRPGGDGMAESALALVHDLTGVPVRPNAPEPRSAPVQLPSESSAPAIPSGAATTAAEGVPLWEGAAIAAGIVCLLLAGGLVLVRRVRTKRLQLVEPYVWKPPDPADPYRYVDRL